MFSSHEMKYIWYLPIKSKFSFYFIQYTGIFLFTKQAVKMQKPKIFENTNNWYGKHQFKQTKFTPFIQIQQTRKSLPNADINNCIAGIHKVGKHKQIAFKMFLYKMCLCRADAKCFILRMVQYHNKRFV